MLTDRVNEELLKVGVAVPRIHINHTQTSNSSAMHLSSQILVSFLQKKVVNTS